MSATRRAVGAKGVAMRVGGARAPMPEVKREALALWREAPAFLLLHAKPFDAEELATLQSGYSTAELRAVKL